MKKLFLIFAVIIGSVLFNTTEAQNVNISINIAEQPAWGPIGYDYVDYYYLPDINVYFDVNRALFYYLNSGRWISSRYLPYSYQRYDFYTMYKVVINNPTPWYYNKQHIKTYAHYIGHRNQPVIKYSNDNRYRNSRNNNVYWTNPDYKQNNNKTTESFYISKNKENSYKEYNSGHNNSRSAINSRTSVNSRPQNTRASQYSNINRTNQLPAQRIERNNRANNQDTRTSQQRGTSTQQPTRTSR